MAMLLGRVCWRPLACSAWASHASALCPHSRAGTVLSPKLSALTSLQDWHARQQSRSHASSGPCRSVAPAAADLRSEYTDTRPKVVFLGTPEVAADVLFRLFKACQHATTNFQIAAVVSQPPTPRKPGKDGRSRPPIPHPVQVLAEEWLHPEQLLLPEKASDADFLASLRALQPDLCITAAYGQMLPDSFLSIPKHGTVNIHPSLLPKYRGAAPVQRSLQHGETKVGVSLLYTVKAMDAGPIIAQQATNIDSGIQADELLLHLFALGTQLFLQHADSILSGEAQHSARPQDPQQATHAAKLDKKESPLDWDLPATVLHNQVRAFTPWPGSKQVFWINNPNAAPDMRNAKPSMKILKTVVGKAEDWQGGARTDITATKDALHVRCNDGSVLSILRLQLPGKKPMTALDFINGTLKQDVTISRLE